METQIYEVELVGSVDSLHKLLQEDAQALDRFMEECYAETPLHVAAMLGHLEFVQEILHRKPELAGKLDSCQSSPLHLAAAKGYLVVVKILVRVNPNMCSHPDRCRRNPLHIAAINGHVHVLKFLVESIHNHELLNFHEFLNSKDFQGNTILHLAVIYKQTEKREEIYFGEELFAIGGGALPTCQLTKNQDLQTIKFLTNSTSIEVNALNADGFTALDMSTQTEREVVDGQIEELLRSAGATSGKDTESLISKHHHIGTQLQTRTPTPHQDLHTNSKPDWIKEQQGSLIVVATLIATIAFQLGVNPPGGVWQEKSDARQTSTGAPPPSPDDYYSHIPGESILADIYPYGYHTIMFFNTVGFTASLGIIVLLISGLPFKSKFVMWILMIIMWAALTAMALTYVTSIFWLSSSAAEKEMLSGHLKAWAGLMMILLLVHTIRLIRKTITWFFRGCGREERL